MIDNSHLEISHFYLAFRAVAKMKLKVPNFFKSVKYCLATVNSLFLLTGILLLTVGLVVLLINSTHADLITKSYLNVPNFVIATGVIILVASILGFYGAISEQFYFIAGYVLLMLVVLIFEIIIICIAYGQKSNAERNLRTSMIQSIQLYESRIEVAKLWDDLQMDFECCGVAGRNDYISNRIPISCCHIDYGTISPFTCDISNSYTTGCSTALGEFLSYNSQIVAVATLVAICMQVPLLAAASWLAWRSKFEEVELES